ncbi:hypothetical protein B0H10DRAFT_1950303 [Mycena sp. CBHHK59/15]|nr:hypothetical protein B0H10DRAFT_1950303 [Mycena sp. CBHHK59/15]
MSHTGDMSPYLSYDLSRTSDCSEKNPNITECLKPALRAAQLSKSNYIEAFQQSPNQESDELPMQSMAWMNWNQGAGHEFWQGHHLPHRDQSADVEAQEKVVKDKFVGQEIKVMGGPYKGYFATVVAMSPHWLSDWKGRQLAPTIQLKFPTRQNTTRDSLSLKHSQQT